MAKKNITLIKETAITEGLINLRIDDKVELRN
jgi:hypothetical protein